MRERAKKAQITMFIILGIVLLLTMSLFFFLSSDQQAQIQEQDTIPITTISTEKVQAQIESCIEENTLIAITLAAQEKRHSDKNKKNNDNTQTNKNEAQLFEAQIEETLQNLLPACSILQQQEFDIDASDTISVEAKVLQEQIQINTNWPIKIKQADSTTTLNTFYYSFPIKINELFLRIENIQKQQALNTSQILSQQINIEINSCDENNIYYTVNDQEFTLQGTPLRLLFAQEQTQTSDIFEQQEQKIFFNLPIPEGTVVLRKNTQKNTQSINSINSINNNNNNHNKNNNNKDTKLVFQTITDQETKTQRLRHCPKEDHIKERSDILPVTFALVTEEAIPAAAITTTLEKITITQESKNKFHFTSNNNKSKNQSGENSTKNITILLKKNNDFVFPQLVKITNENQNIQSTDNNTNSSNTTNTMTTAKAKIIEKEILSSTQENNYLLTRTSLPATIMQEESSCETLQAQNSSSTKTIALTGLYYKNNKEFFVAANKIMRAVSPHILTEYQFIFEESLAECRTLNSPLCSASEIRKTVQNNCKEKSADLIIALINNPTIPAQYKIESNTVFVGTAALANNGKENAESNNNNNNQNTQICTECAILSAVAKAIQTPITVQNTENNNISNSSNTTNTTTTDINILDVPMPAINISYEQITVTQAQQEYIRNWQESQ